MAANNHIGSLSKQYNLSLLYPRPLDGWNKSDTLVYTLPNSIPAGNYEAEIGHPLSRILSLQRYLVRSQP